MIPEPRVESTGHEISKDCMKKTWEGIDAPVENNMRAPITSHSKTNEHKMVSVTNIIIFSALFGVVLTKEIGEIKENSLLKESSRWKSSDTRNKDELNKKAIEDTLISAYDCLDNSLPSTRI